MIRSNVLRRATILVGLLFIAIFISFGFLVRFRVGRLPSVRFGHTLMNTEIYLCKRLMDRKTFHLPLHFDLIFLMEGFVPNLALASLVKRSLPIYPSWLIYPLWVWVRRFDLKSMQIPEIDQMMADNKNLLANTPPQLQLSDNEVSLAKSELVSIGLSSQQSWVCLFPRSSQFLLDNIPHLYQSSAPNDNLRNADPSVLLQTTSKLVTMGYTVIFMGKSSGHDYKLFKERFNAGILFREELDISDHADLYLGSACDFYVSSPSGAENTADVLGRRPVLNFDVITIANQAIYLPTKLSIFKLHYSKKFQRFLKLEEIKRIGSHCFIHSSQFDQAGIELVPNTEQDILELINEFLFLRDRGWDRTVLATAGKLGLELNKIIGLDVPKGYPTAMQDRIIRYAEVFLEKNYDILF